MATSKTLEPTNVTISIPAMTDAPNASVLSNCIDKEADAINTLNSQSAKKESIYKAQNGTATITFSTYQTSAIIYCAGASEKGVLLLFSNGYLCSVKEDTGFSHTISSDYKTITVTVPNNTYVAVVLTGQGTVSIS